MKRSLCVAALGFCLVPFAWPGEIVLFDNIQHGIGGGSWEISERQNIGIPFHSTVNGTLSEVRLVLYPELNAGPIFYRVAITDALNGVPGPNTLYEWSSVQGAMPNVLHFSRDVPVVPGGSYFVTVGLADQSPLGLWIWSYSAGGPFAVRYWGTWYPAVGIHSAMTVKAITEDSVPAVPGPAAAIPFALGLLARRRRRR
ncbi:MAG: hypothetical protein WHU10_05100 [Fimbriimonadales bacterium]